MLHCHDGHFAKARFASRIRIDEQDFGGGLGPRHAGGPDGRKLFPEEAFSSSLSERQHGTRAARGSEFKANRFFGRLFHSAFDGGSFEFHRQKILKHGAAIGIGVKRLPATTTRAPPKRETNSLRFSRFTALMWRGSTSPKMTRSYLNNSLARRKLCDAWRVLAANNAGITLDEKTIEFDAAIAQKHDLKIPELPARRLLDHKHLDFASTTRSRWERALLSLTASSLRGAMDASSSKSP